ncbi:unnamed protein product [Arctogadus glacialis]
MRAATDGLLAKHHGAKGILKRVDAEYAATVQRPCTDPNSLLHSTTCQHISRYVKHLAKLKNTSSSQHQPREGFGDSAAVAEFDHRQPNSLCTRHNPASCDRQPSSCGSPPPEESLSRATVEKIVTEILQKQQQQPQQKKKSPEVKYFYCSTRVFKMYGDEGLKDPRMSFEGFAASPFFAREIEAVEERSAACKKVAEERTKRKSALQRPTGFLFRFCPQPLK